MFLEAAKIYNFIKRDALSFSTYKTNLLLMMLGSFFGALSYSYLGENATMQIVLDEYKMPLVTYLITGVAFSTFIGQSLISVHQAINPWTLEEILVSPTRLSTYIIGSSAWGYILSASNVFVYLCVGLLAFKMQLAINLFETLLVLALGVGTFFGISMIGAGVQLIIKRGDPVTWLMGSLISLFGNVFFPPQVMPSYLSTISYVLPHYYFFTAIRLALTGRSWPTVWPYILTLALMCALTLCAGYLLFCLCLRKVRMDGTLSWF